MSRARQRLSDVPAVNKSILEQVIQETVTLIQTEQNTATVLQYIQDTRNQVNANSGDYNKYKFIAGIIESIIESGRTDLFVQLIDAEGIGYCYLCYPDRESKNKTKLKRDFSILDLTVMYGQPRMAKIVIERLRQLNSEHNYKRRHERDGIENMMQNALRQAVIKKR